jgi:hypothetical protein
LSPNKREGKVVVSQDTEILKATATTVTTVSNVLFTKHKEQIDSILKIAKTSSKLFGAIQCDPKRPSVVFTARDTDRYLFFRAKAISVDFFNIMGQSFGPDQVGKLAL